MRTLIPIVAAACMIAPTGAIGQLRAPYPHAERELYAAAPYAAENVALESANPQREEPRFSPENLRWRKLALIGGSVAAMAAYGKEKWWDDGFTGDFQTQNEDWFGQNTKDGGADKLGHAFFAYTGTRMLARAFEFVGNEPRSALNLGFWTALGIMTAVEVADGYSKQYRFSAQDAVMNLVGAGLGYLIEGSPVLDRLIDVRLHYRASANSSWDPGGDYSGQTYLLVLKASGVTALRSNELLRYLEVGVGYGSRGYENPSPPFEHKRNLYFGVSLNISEILRQTVYRNNREPSWVQKGTETFFEFIQVPGTGIAAKHKL